MTGRLCLLVVGEKQFATHWLPESGKVTLGHAETCDVRINEATVSPIHAVLHLDPQLAIEDLGSASGTRVGDVVLQPGRPTPLLPGSPISLGSVAVIIQKSSQAPPRRIWTHGYFESRLEEECIRADRFKSQFSVLRIQCEPTVSGALVEEILANILRLVDVVGSYRPGEYEVILQGTNPEGADLVARRTLASLTERGAKAKIGLACYPRDGRSADALSATAGAAAHGESTLKHDLGSEPPDSRGESGPMQHIHRLVERIAASTINVLIMGETGVGKERLAERVHQLSPRARKPFLRLNVAALTESLLESELFGHERGAFTGAVQAKPGLLETASGGTVFLDEIGELPMNIQVKLLRVLEGQQVFRVGSTKPRSIDARFLAATNRDLEAEVERGLFRQDLFFRLNGIAFVVPPLRERVSEIDGLAKTFITEMCRKSNRSPEPVIAPEAIMLMKRYGWPGNIRELRNVIERAVLLCASGPITLADLPVEKMSATFAARQVPQRPPVPPRSEISIAEMNGASSLVEAAKPPENAVEQRAHVNGVSNGVDKDLRVEMKAYERQRILDALATCAGNQTAAAKLLGVSRRMLVNRLNAYDIPRPRKGRSASGK